MSLEIFSKYILFEKDNLNTLENVVKHQSLKVVFWKNYKFPLTPSGTLSRGPHTMSKIIGTYFTKK